MDKNIWQPYLQTRAEYLRRQIGNHGYRFETDE